MRVVSSSMQPGECLLTPPESGCVRLWDPSISSDDDPQKNCTIIAEVDADISAFSLGERGTKEHTLMVCVFVFSHLVAKSMPDPCFPNPSPSVPLPASVASRRFSRYRYRELTLSAAATHEEEFISTIKPTEGPSRT